MATSSRFKIAAASAGLAAWTLAVAALVGSRTADPIGF